MYKFHFLFLRNMSYIFYTFTKVNKLIPLFNNLQNYKNK